MKRYLWNTLTLLVVGILLGACSPDDTNNDKYHLEAIVANVAIADKGITNDGQYWIMAAYPDKKKLKSVVRFDVEKELWDTIEINQKYTVHYAKRENGTYSLYKIIPLTD
ncbi:hypothetical protein SAMN05216378_5346 [Paenibacillus catalpae]|uniref:Uncharacterized protein n=1 Tax=Paenibacillus catalpae TaxID=1045775 RepID=A0A1I2GNB6_9BACL|nr:hypothetical protein [Paenibacillus catalpae]SFF18499.1 hypothetical protein SAMN05216378_5346 [Paenibacillus catalpae]